MRDELYRNIDNLEDFLCEKPLKPTLLDDELLICECNCVSVKDIKMLFHDERVVNVETLTRVLKLGSGCGSCLKSCDEWKDRIF
jgi:NAD(P)H-nitrite reductase large subunit